jgi:hypothetical protein
MAKTKVKKKSPQEPPVSKIINSYPENNGSLGRRIEFGAKSHVYINKPGMKVEWFTPTVDCLIGIGKNHVANLIMDVDAWEALKKGEDINITTIQKFKKGFL